MCICITSFGRSIHERKIVNPNLPFKCQLRKKWFYILSIYFEVINIYQFKKNDKGTPLDFIQKMQQTQISQAKIDICVISIKRDVVVWNRIFYGFFKKIDDYCIRFHNSSSRFMKITQISILQYDIQFCSIFLIKA